MGDSPSSPAAEPRRTHRFRIGGMSGQGCIARVERALREVPGVENVIVDLDHAEAVVSAAAERDPAELGLAVDAALDAAGYRLIKASGAPDPDPDPAPAPAEPPPAPPTEPIYADDERAPERAADWRAWLPSWPTVWYVATRGVLIALAASFFFTLIYRFVPVPFTLLMVGESLFEGRDIHREWVPLERISPNLVRAVIASEDNEFCRHWGFDFKELRDALNESRNGGRMRGASTISQQTAKNVFLWPGRSYLRKGFEVYFTVMIETFWPKRRIMEVYLNVIEWGPGVFGAEAAARRWFGKSASKLTPLEAARLAAILPNPNRYRANPPGPYVNSRGYTIAARANSVDLNRDDRCAKP